MPKEEEAVLLSLRCRVCGEELNLQDHRVLSDKLIMWTCMDCGYHLLWTETLESNEQDFAFAYEKARRLRESGAFEDAEGIYQEILERDDDQVEAYRGIALCRYGVRFCREEGRLRPVVEYAQDLEFTEDSAFLTALEKAGKAAEKYLMEEGARIEEAREKAQRILPKSAFSEAAAGEEGEKAEVAASEEGEKAEVAASEEGRTSEVPEKPTTYQQSLDPRDRRELELLRSNAEIYMKLGSYERAEETYARLRDHYPGVYEAWKGMIQSRTANLTRSDCDQKELNEWMRCARLLEAKESEHRAFEAAYLSYKRMVYASELAAIRGKLEQEVKKLQAEYEGCEETIRLIEGERKRRQSLTRDDQEECERIMNFCHRFDGIWAQLCSHKLLVLGIPVLVVCFLYLLQILKRGGLLLGAMLLFLFTALVCLGNRYRLMRIELEEEECSLLGKELLAYLEESQLRIDRCKQKKEELQEMIAEKKAGLDRPREELEQEFLKKEMGIE